MNVAISKELVMAYADGELDAARAASLRLQEAVNTDATLRSQYDIFLQTRAILATAFNDIMDEPVPDTLKAPFSDARRGKS